MKLYEGMFLFDSTAVHQWSEMEAEVRRLCDRIQADLEVCVKFDERKLAYEIKGRKRGTYVLAYFNADPDRIADLHRDVQLSELILRLLVLRADKVSDARLAELKALPPEQPLQPSSGDGRRGEGEAQKGRPVPPAGGRRVAVGASAVEEGKGEVHGEPARATTSRAADAATAEAARESSGAREAAADTETASEVASEKAPADDPAEEDD